MSDHIHATAGEPRIEVRVSVKPQLKERLEATAEALGVPAHEYVRLALARQVASDERDFRPGLFQPFDRRAEDGEGE